MATYSLSILDLAQQGNPQVIAALMNRSFQPRGITAKAALKNRCLKILLEATSIPNQHVLTAVIHSGILRLGIAELQQLTIYGRQVGQKYPAWSQDFQLMHPPQPTFPIAAAADGLLPGAEEDAADEATSIWQSRRKGCLVASLLMLFGVHGVTLLAGDRAPSEPAPPAAPPDNAPAINKRAITPAVFEDPWMLTIEEGELLCESPNTVVLMTDSGEKYAVNEAANAKGYADIRAILQDDPARSGMKMSLSPLISEGLELCR